MRRCDYTALKRPQALVEGLSSDRLVSDTKRAVFNLLAGRRSKTCYAAAGQPCCLDLRACIFALFKNKEVSRLNAIRDKIRKHQ